MYKELNLIRGKRNKTLQSQKKFYKINKTNQYKSIVAIQRITFENDIIYISCFQ